MKDITRIVVLGVIAVRGPLTGYRIQKVLGEWHAERWAAIAPASIYNQLKGLQKQGSIRLLDQASGTPKYEITVDGRDELERMIIARFDQPDPQPLSLEPVLYFLPLINPATILNHLRERTLRIRTLLANYDAWIERATSTGPAHIREMFELARRGYEADLHWSEEFTTRWTRQIDL